MNCKCRVCGKFFYWEGCNDPKIEKVICQSCENIEDENKEKEEDLEENQKEE